jgi:hypothetical protein
MGCARLTGLILLGIFVAAAHCRAAEPATLPPKERLLQVWVNIGDDPWNWAAVVNAKGKLITNVGDFISQVKATLAEMGRAGIEVGRVEVVIFAFGPGSRQWEPVYVPMLESLRKLGVASVRLATEVDVYGERPTGKQGMTYSVGSTALLAEVPAGTSRLLAELMDARKSKRISPERIEAKQSVGTGFGQTVHLTERGTVIDDLSGFLFLCDASESVKDFDLARAQLLAGIDSVKTLQTFAVIVCQNGNAVAMEEGRFVLGLPEMKRKARAFLDGVKPKGSAGILAGMTAALGNDPRKIFLVTAGDPPNGDGVLKLLALDTDRRGPLPVVNVLNTDRDGKLPDAILKKIAEATGGWVMRLTDDKQLLARAVVPKVYQIIAVEYRPDYSWSAAFWDDLGSARSQKQFAALVDKGKEKLAKEGTRPEEVDLLLRINSATGVPDELVRGMRKAVSDAGFTMAHAVMTHDADAAGGRDVPPVRQVNPNGTRGETPLAPFGIPGTGGGIGPRVSFAGMNGNAMRVVVVGDVSTSARRDFDFRAETTRLVDALKPIQAFDVAYYQDGKVRWMNSKLVEATAEQKAAASKFLATFRPEGSGGDPTAALRGAYALKPNVIYFATAGDLKDPVAVARLMRELDPTGRVRVAVVGLAHDDPKADRALAQMVEATKADYRKFEPVAPAAGGDKR